MKSKTNPKKVVHKNSYKTELYVAIVATFFLFLGLFVWKEKANLLGTDNNYPKAWKKTKNSMGIIYYPETGFNQGP
jgi:hypothetical protein